MGSPFLTRPAAIVRRLGTAAALASTLLIPGTQAQDTPAPPTSLASLYQDAVRPVTADHEILAFLLGGTPKLELRGSYEYSDYDDAADKDPASGLQLRSRVSYKSGVLHDSSFFVMLQNEWNIVEDYRWPGGGDVSHDVIADPDGTRLQQVYADFGFIPDLTIRVGLQEIVLDDARLIGNVGWRQNAQAFTGVGATYKGIDKVELYGAFIWDVYDIFLKNNPDMESLILLRGQYSYSPKLTVAAFAYLNDVEADAKDSATIGLRGWGRCDWLTYDVTGAMQLDYQDGDHSGQLLSAKLGTAGYPINGTVGYQYISGGTDGDAFDTLYSTAHAYNGWSDQFLATNGGGLTGGLHDVWIEGKTTWNDIGFTLGYHYFHTTEEAANGFDGEYGQELDADVTYAITKNLKAQLRGAAYFSADGAKNPTEDELLAVARLTFTF